MIPSIRAALFDLDGVVVYTDRFHYLAWKAMANRNGWKFDEALNHQLRGISRGASLDIILQHNDVALDEETKARLAEEKNAEYVRMLQGIGAEDVVPHAIPFIEALRARGIKTALCSASRNARMVLDLLGIGHFFDAVVTGADVVRSKPDPEIFLKAAQMLALHPFNCIVFEDAVAGIEAAVAAGMRHVGVGRREDFPNALQTTTDYRQIDLDALIEIAKISRITAHPWAVVEGTSDSRPAGYWESVFALCNGTLGLRGTVDEEDGAGAPGFFVNGLHGLEKDMGFRTAGGKPCRSQIMMNLADWRILEAHVGGEAVNPRTGTLHSYHRELDLRRGVLVRSFEWESPQGRRVRVTSERVVCMARPRQAAIRYRIEALNFSGGVRIVSKTRLHTFTRQFGFEGAPVSGANTTPEGAAFRFEMFGSGMLFDLALHHRLSGGGSITTNEIADGLHTFEVTASLESGGCLVVEKHAAVRDDETESVSDEPAALAAESARLGFDILLAEQVTWWRNYWTLADIAIEGCPSDQQALRFNIFQLRQNLPSDDRHSISATGLTGANYMGWVFWDTEAFMLPFFLHTEPAAARSLLVYRHGQLDAARRKAADLGLPGTLFPWSTINGDETNSGHMVSTGQFHINADIAHAIRRYVEATGDVDFLRTHGAEMLFETARFLTAHGRFLDRKGGQFCLHTVCGPDEYNYPVNNNAYTNAMFQAHSRYAAETWDFLAAGHPEDLDRLAARIGLTAAEVDTWREIARRMYIPFDAALGIHEQHDGYLEKYPLDMSTVPRNYELKHDLPELRLLQLQVTKQADVVLLMHVLGNDFSTATKKANYDFYEPRTLHSSSLSPSVHGLVAAEIGYEGAAYDYFRLSAFLDLDDVKNNTRDGVHFACAGGTLMLALEGFLGVRHEPDGRLFLRPRLPKEWTRCECAIHHRGSTVRVEIAGDGLSLVLMDGPEVTVSVGGVAKTLTPQGLPATPDECRAGAARTHFALAHGDVGASPI